MELTPIPNLEGYYMSDAVSVFKLKNGKPDPVYPFHRKREEQCFYVRVWFNGKRTVRSINRLAEQTFGMMAEPVCDSKIRLPEYPSYSFFVKNGHVRVFKGPREITANRHPRGKQNYFSLVDYTGKRSSVQESTLRNMCGDEQ